MKLAEDFTYLIMKVTQNGAKYRTPQLGRDLKGASFGVSLHAVELSLGSFPWGLSVTGSAPPCGSSAFHLWVLANAQKLFLANWL